MCCASVKWKLLLLGLLYDHLVCWGTTNRRRRRRRDVEKKSKFVHETHSHSWIAAFHTIFISLSLVYFISFFPFILFLLRCRFHVSAYFSLSLWVCASWAHFYGYVCVCVCNFLRLFRCCLCFFLFFHPLPSCTLCYRTKTSEWILKLLLRRATTLLYIFINTWISHLMVGTSNFYKRKLFHFRSFVTLSAPPLAKFCVCVLRSFIFYENVLFPFFCCSSMPFLSLCLHFSHLPSPSSSAFTLSLTSHCILVFLLVSTKALSNIFVSTFLSRSPLSALRSSSSF